MVQRREAVQPQVESDATGSEADRTFATAIWGREDRISMETCRFIDLAGGGHRLDGTVIYRGKGGPSQAIYRVDTDDRWYTRVVDVAVLDLNGRSEVHLLADGNGNWQHNGVPMALPYPCYDVDIAITPSTNTLPIRRCDIEVGGSETINVMWLSVPSFKPEPGQQTYKRVDKLTYRFGGTYGSYRIDVDRHGVVLEYPGGGWRALHNRSIPIRSPRS